ncbi:MAG: nitronate monooxygenase family protein [Chloroflexota bacterium]
MKTRLTELLGIKHPIIQSGMSIVADPALVIAVCNAGGLGILGTSRASPEVLRQQIRDIRDHVRGKPFAVNLVPIRPGFKRYVDVVLEEKVPALSSGIRDPFKTAGIKKPDSILYVATVGAVRPAVSVEKAGADIVIVQGWEGGGHASQIASTVLIPEAVAAVRVPVVAAGGFSDGKGLAAALCLGAEGIAMGTRFAVVKESPIPDKLKQDFVNAADRDAILSASWDGMPYRVIAGQKMKRYRGWLSRPWDVLPSFLSTKRDYNCSFKDMMDTFSLVRRMRWSPPQFLVGLEIVRKTLQTGDLGRGFCPSGQVVGRINDVPTSRELIERTVAEAEQIIQGLNKKL